MLQFLCLYQNHWSLSRLQPVTLMLLEDIIFHLQLFIPFYLLWCWISSTSVPPAMTRPPLNVSSHLTSIDIIIGAVVTALCHCQCLSTVLLAQHTMFAVKISSKQSERPFKESLLMLNIATSNQQWKVAPNWFGKWIWQHCYTAWNRHDVNVVTVALTNYSTTFSFTKTNHPRCRINILISARKAHKLWF